ncbi:MAG: hypothetical protein LC118_06965 [Dehalococcoidia bacterium]|nr:hypothetical protein [Dehalococcoidia bacterium]
MEKSVARVRRSAGSWVVTFDDGTSVLFHSEREAVAYALQWVLANRGTRMYVDSNGG